MEDLESAEEEAGRRLTAKQEPILRVMGYLRGLPAAKLNRIFLKQLSNLPRLLRLGNV